MLISEVIQKIKDYSKGEMGGVKIDEETTRDKILYGDPNQECTGIVTCIWASVNVIQQAIECGANLIIPHEALFYNHGDHTDWLQDTNNATYLRKKKLLDDYGIVVWRDHDYIHSGVPIDDGKYVDGIFYGLAKKLGWEDYIQFDRARPTAFDIPEMSAEDLGEFLVERLGLNGIKLYGNPEAKVSKIRIPSHVFGEAKDTITKADKENINCFLSLELIDFTLSEYVRDSSMLGDDRVILGMGHFNLEEPGMEYMINYLPEILKEDIPMKFATAGDMYRYIVRKGK